MTCRSPNSPPTFADLDRLVEDLIVRVEELRVGVGALPLAAQDSRGHRGRLSKAISEQAYRLFEVSARLNGTEPAPAPKVVGEVGVLVRGK